MSDLNQLRKKLKEDGLIHSDEDFSLIKGWMLKIASIEYEFYCLQKDVLNSIGNVVKMDEIGTGKGLHQQIKDAA